MRYRLILFTMALAVLSGGTQSSGTPQHASVEAARDARLSPDRGARLAFSADGKVLHAIGNSRAITYSADTGAVTNLVNLDPDTRVLSNTADGRMAILAVGTPENPSRLVMLSTETGQREDIPSSWYDPKDDDPSAELSGDGRLIGIYSESDTDRPMAVTVYDWPTKALIAKQTSERISAGGGFGGGVTVDGAIEFVNNRVGRKVVNLKTGGLIGWFGFDSWRSSNGAWAVGLPNQWTQSPPWDVLIKDGASGQTSGKLVDVQIAGYEDGRDWEEGAFCGTTGRFVLAHRGGVAMYGIPSGMLLATFATASWRDASAEDSYPVSVACSSNGRRVAILSGTRLTFHDLK